MSADIEKTYQKKTQLEHILLRPDTYIGSIESDTTELWVYQDGEEKFVNKKIEYVPGLYKIFDEILVNAADNYQRDSTMDSIKVTISKEKNMISVWNNGQGIPVQIHKEYNIYVPELIFGHLLTSSNYDDTKKKVTGGRNGYGAKLTNIFSKKFTIETADSKSKKCFKMVWKNNMSECSQPEIKDNKSGDNYTCITFEPDLKRFKMSELTDDIIALMKKRVYDLAGVISTSVKVSLNDKKIPIRGFSNYVDMYLDEEPIKISEKEKKNKNDRWELIVSHSDGQFQQVSFVNSICTSSGGTHVTYIVDQITNKLQETIKKKHKELKDIKPFQIKNHLSIFLNTLIENPAFSSQTKELLITKAAQFGSSYEISDKMLSEIVKSRIIEQIVAQAKAKEKAKFEKTMKGDKKSRLLGIPKLEDANDAGTRNAEFCTLILTEGDSAKALAMAGIEVVGRDRYGVFPLKGKMLNVRDAKIKDISKNEEVQNLIKILGLQVNKNYENVKQLRYGSIMIMADQDQDGSHIKGLIINFIQHFWPSLFENNGFLREFVTPLIKATKGTQEKSFFTMNDFKTWSQTVDIKTWKVKYYKGLGTSSDKEGKEYFANISKHVINFKYANTDDVEAIDLAFNKSKADNRKEWLKTHDPENTVDHNIKQLRYKDFVHKELLQFSYYDTIRSIPSLCDGLKPGQRKILYGCFKRNLKNEIKVAQLGGYISEHAAYHHGEASLASTIIGMAQSFVGSNNIHLLMPNGQFGSRNLGGKDSASARYLHTTLNKVTRVIFHEDDDHLYKYLEDDGQMVEPEWYLPVIPMALVNGADGIGTGWSTSIPCYNPREITQNLRARLEGKPFPPMKPWFKGYSGIIDEAAKEKGYNVFGKYEILDDDTLRITELPIRIWTRNYKNFLEEMLNPKEGEPEIEDIKEYHTNNTVDFVVRMVPGKLEKIIKGDGIEKKFKLNSKFSTTNMVLFDSQGKPKKFDSVEEIMEEFYNLRMVYYDKRKDYLLSKLQRDLEILENKKRFILAVIAEDIKVRNVKKNVIIQDLVRKGYKMMSEMHKIKSTKMEKQAHLPRQEDEEAKEEGMEIEEEGNGTVPAKEYNYLLSLPIWSLTYEKVEQLKQEYDRKAGELEVLRRTEVKTMYERDLDEVLKVLGDVEDKEKKDDEKTRKKKHSKESLLKMAKTNGGGAKRKTKGATKKKAKTINSDGEEDSASDGDGDEDFVAKKITKGGKEKAPKETKLRKTKSAIESLEPSDKSKEISLSQPVAGEKEKVKKPRLKKNNSSSMIIEESNKENESKPSSQDNSKSSYLMQIEKEREEPKPKQKTPPKFDMNNSILKYLYKPSANTTKSEKSEAPVLADTQSNVFSLSERIKMRESSGDISTFNDTYNSYKKSPTKELSQILKTSSLNEKREPEFDLDKAKKKKVKLAKSDDEESDFDMEKWDSLGRSLKSGEETTKTTTNTLSTSRPTRRAAANRKAIILSDDEDEKKSDKSVVIEMEEEEECFF